MGPAVAGPSHGKARQQLRLLLQRYALPNCMANSSRPSSHACPLIPYFQPYSPFYINKLLVFIM